MNSLAIRPLENYAAHRVLLNHPLPEPVVRRRSSARVWSLAVGLLALGTLDAVLILTQSGWLERTLADLPVPQDRAATRELVPAGNPWQAEANLALVEQTCQTARLWLAKARDVRTVLAVSLQGR